MTRLALIAAVLIVAAVAVWHPAPQPAFLTSTPAPAPPGRPHRTARAADAPTAPALVYVVGAVRRAGLYRLRPAARVNDAVSAAGGLAPDADPAGVNLAARVADGDEIAVPRIGEKPAPAARSRRSTRSRRAASTKLTDAVELNAADAATLARVPGIGRVIAERIVTLREREGPYDTLDELLDVAGMTPSRLDRASSYLRI